MGHLLRHDLEDYIWNKIDFYPGDNHSSNDKVCREGHQLGATRAEDSMPWAHGHAIMIAVQAFPFMDSTRKLHEPL
ncbi:ribonuclease H-like protein [Purpureocillium lavendulum]|uniref:Ribonuclease H-like protein n=1 Tax=Purpureocillium lavendulum TaxID=1247861 RepID=A0AB34FD56_9HYPO|nr:ribonuclease H-like protein [Purpureocillium lavendulum]